jgi:streptogramin lyase
MVRSTAFILIILLFLTCLGPMSCGGPKPKATPPFFKLGDNVYFVAAAPDGSVWVSLSEYGDEYSTIPVSYGTGVAHLTAPVASTGDRKKWTTYTTKDGLPSNWAYPIAPAADGTVWFGTADGATRSPPCRQHR